MAVATVAVDSERTTVFAPRGIAASEADGFPLVDDLSERRLGPYELGPMIGRGSMGRVYRGEHVGLKRPCAIKVMNPSLVRREPETVEQFWGEARAIAALPHPNIVAVHNLGTERGYHFIEMELVEHREPRWLELYEQGGSYRREYAPGGLSLTEKVVEEGPIEARLATQMVRQVALALSAAHKEGLIHRDVKPANVLLTSDNQAKLADFGLVRRATEGPLHRATLAGTPTFMAPELFLGSAATAATDLYALGVTYYYLLSARLPHTSDRLTRLVRLKMREEPPEIREVAPRTPDDVAAIVNRLLAPKPQRRYDSADAVAHDLRIVLGNLRDTTSLVEEAIEGLSALVQHGDVDRYRVILPVPGDRLQEVYIEVHDGPDQERLLSVYSLCGPADPAYFEYALRLNADLTHGSLSIHELHDRAMFVMSQTFTRSHVTPLEIRSAVQEIARHADRIEHRLTQTDVY
jgi:serine/threonine-protein kinase